MHESDGSDDFVVLAKQWSNRSIVHGFLLYLNEVFDTWELVAWDFQQAIGGRTCIDFRCMRLKEKVTPEQGQ